MAIGENVGVHLESTEQVDRYTLFRFADLDAKSVSTALLRLVSGSTVVAERRLTISVTDVKKAVRAMKRKSDPTIRQMAGLMESTRRLPKKAPSA